MLVGFIVSYDSLVINWQRLNEGPVILGIPLPPKVTIEKPKVATSNPFDEILTKN
jgi:hypothetical protein